MVALFAPYRIDGATPRPRFKTDVFCLLSLIVFVHVFFFHRIQRGAINAAYQRLFLEM